MPYMALLATRGKAFTCTWPRRRARSIGCSCTGWLG